jgi:hypothetical protein
LELEKNPTNINEKDVFKRMREIKHIKNIVTLPVKSSIQTLDYSSTHITLGNLESTNPQTE